MKTINFYQPTKEHVGVAIWDKAKAKYLMKYLEKELKSDVYVDDIFEFKEQHGYLEEHELNQINIFDL